MNRKHLPRETATHSRGPKVRVRNLEAGRSSLAVARPVIRASWGAADWHNHETCRRARVRAPPVAEMDRADGWLHRPESPTRTPQPQQRKGSDVQLSHFITRTAGSETSARQGYSPTDRVHAP
jgi:hypothetical protein